MTALSRLLMVPLAALIPLLPGCATAGKAPHPATVSSPDKVQATAEPEMTLRVEQSAQEAAAAYGYAPGQGEALHFAGASVLPAVVHAGDTITGSITCVLLGAGDGAQICEQRVLKRENKELVLLPKHTITRADGSWTMSQDYRLPADLTPGTYTMETRVSTAVSEIRGRANFVVE